MQQRSTPIVSLIIVDCFTDILVLFVFFCCRTYSVLRVALLRTLARQYVSANQTVKLQYSGQFFSSSSDNENKDHFTDNMEYTITEKDIVREPSRERFGILKTAFVIISGIYFGAWLAMVGATVLEDLEIFVNEDDDDED